MTRKLTTHLIPATIVSSTLPDSIGVIIDILRATSTITTAIANGAEAVFPCLSIESATEFRRTSATAVLLGGERGGQKIDGFDFGNSPAEFTTEAVDRRLIGFTTTNGTKALLSAGQASQVLIGSFLNLSVVAEYLLRQSADVQLICAGTDGEVTLEDTLFAGKLACELVSNSEWEMNDATRLTIQWSSTVADSAAAYSRLFEQSLGGRNLVAIGMQSDLDWCAERNKFSILPSWNRQSGLIQPIFD